jgi:hypothetical protein
MNMIESAVWNAEGTYIKVTTVEGAVLWVPDDMANPYRQELEEWSMVKGNMIQPYQPPIEVQPKAKRK